MTNPTDELLASMSLEDKVALTTGAGWFHTYASGEVKSVQMSDGPHGLRLQQSASLMSESRPATCFPPAVALGSTWDPSLIQRVGVALGEECRVEGVHVLLGPGINIKRSPLCGRNFEYFSEDPLVSGVLGSAWVRGVQSQGVGASLKHFAVNNQETLRMSVSADVDERALHEIYLRAFARVVREAQPWTVMCSYNRINGVYASEHEWLLTTMLRERYGFEGVVVSDWGAVVDRVRALRAGLDLEMPASRHGVDHVLAALASGEIDEALVDRSARRLINLSLESHATPPLAHYDADAHQKLAREAATRAVVLLKNEGDLVPLDPSSTQTIGVIGEFARTPRYQGSGSSRVVPTSLETALDAITTLASGPVCFAPGFDPDHAESSATLRDEALALARDVDVVILFLGLSGAEESEGFDREHLRLSEEQQALARDVVKENERVIVVLSNGGAVELASWAYDVPVLFEGWLLGQAGAQALADLLFGVASPSGRLAETLAIRLEDTPSFHNFPGDYDHVRYGEGVFVGYRHFDRANAPVSYPFGFGLTYTTFSYGVPTVEVTPTGIDVTVTVTNTGSRGAHEVVQLYVGALASRVTRPVRELKAFATPFLEVGETTVVSLHVERDELAYFDPALHDWVVESTTYRVELGRSSRDIVAQVDVAVVGDDWLPVLSAESTFGQWMTHPVGGPILVEILSEHASHDAEGRSIPEPGTMMFRMVEGFRLNQFTEFFNLPLSEEEIADVVARVNS